MEAYDMNRWKWTALLLLSLMVLTVSCRQLFTTSLGSALARDGIDIPSNASIDELLEIAQGDYGSDPDVSKELLDVFAEKDAADLIALSSDDKGVILNLAASAAVDMDTLTDLGIKAGDDAYNSDDLVAAAFNSFDTSVDLTAIEILLADENTINTAPVDSIILAAAVVCADVVAACGAGGSTLVMNALSSGSTAGLPLDQQARIQAIIDAVPDLEARDETADLSFGDFKLIDFLKG